MGLDIQSIMAFFRNLLYRTSDQKDYPKGVSKMNVPYASATSGLKARDDIGKILRTFGCQSVGWLDEYDTNSIVLAFIWNGKRVQLRASANGWASMYLRKKPWNTRRAKDRRDYEQQALDQGMIAVNSVLRDWVKGQITAIEIGILSFETVFMPHMLTHEGKTLAESEVITKLLSHGDN